MCFIEAGLVENKSYEVCYSAEADDEAECADEPLFSYTSTCFIEMLIVAYEI